METLLALVITFCSYQYPMDTQKEKICISEFNKCRERQIWGYLDYAGPHELDEMEHSAFLDCHEHFLKGNRKWH